MNKTFHHDLLELDELTELNTKLWLAVKYNQFKKAKRFLAQDATIHTFTGEQLRRYDPDENTTLHIAAKQGFIELVELLWKYGADIHSKNRLNQTPVQLAAINGYTDVVTFLIERGADPAQKPTTPIT